MVPYILLILIPVLFSVVVYKAPQAQTAEGLMRDDDYVRRFNLTIPVFFAMLVIMLVLRHETVGIDLLNYKYYFNLYRGLPFQTLFAVEIEPLYAVLSWLIGQMTENYQIFLAVVALLTVLPIAVLYAEDREYGCLKIALYLNMSTFVMLFSGLRQSLAIAVGIVAYFFVRKKHLLRFLICVAVAMGFHTSAIVLLLLYPCYHAKFKKQHLWFLIPTLLLVFVFNRYLFSFLSKVLNRYLGEQYEAVATSTGAYTMLLVFAAFAFLCYFIPEEDQMDDETLGLRNVMLLAVLLQCFAPIHPLAMRMNYYFIILIPILMPKIFKCKKEAYEELARLFEIGLTLFFFAYFLLDTLTAYRTGSGALNTVPYVPFWKD